MLSSQGLKIIFPNSSSNQTTTKALEYSYYRLIYNVNYMYMYVAICFVQLLVTLPISAFDILWLILFLYFVL